MRFIEFSKRYSLQALFVVLVFAFAFIYFVVYLTDSRVAWYTTMFTQAMSMVEEVRKVIGVR